MSDSFVHLHAHSCYSLLDGLARIDDLLDSAVEQGMPALALTDHGTMFGAIEFYGAAKQRGLKPIIGCEVYVADRPLGERPGPGAQNFHLVLLAQNETGYRNLIRLSTEAHLRGFYRKPRVDHDLLERHADGLICLSGCASSELSAHLLAGDSSAAGSLADWYHQIFGERYYLELQDHGLPFQKTINEGILDLHRRLGLPLVASNDVHYVRKRQARTHEILLCIQTQTTLGDPKRMRMEAEEFYLKSPEEMYSLFSDYPEALRNSLEIAGRCELEITFGRPQLPVVPLPEGVAPGEQLRRLCAEGLTERYGEPGDAVRSRLDYELDVIERTGFTEYFLLVHDVIHFARSRGIAVGPGRGSAAGSIVAYSLFLTNVDPVAHGLSFERFLNPERVSMPDFDLDFADDRRDEVIRYVSERYGSDRVAQIITFGTIGARAGIRDVGRVLDLPLADVDRAAKLVPFMCSSIIRAREQVPELAEMYDRDPVMHDLMETVEDLEGVARHASTHAAGVVISRDRLAEHVPLYRVPKNGQVTTQYAMSSVEKIGLLKMDFLGLRTLTILERASALVRQVSGRDFRPDQIPLEDPSIYELLSAGETFGVFQVDGAGMHKTIRQVRPTEFNHVVALNALYRPGPMAHIEEFAARKNGERAVSYDHPALEEVLAETYGIVVYQEQVMELAVRLAGYTMGEGDLLRRAMGKKKPEELARHREQFVERAEARGTSRDVASHIFDVIEPFAGYAFNKSHAAAYSVITCQTAYLKANHPREFMAGLLSAERDNSDRVAEAAAECRRLGIRLLGPDVNGSELDFTLEDGGIRFGLGAIKHVGQGAVEAILTERMGRGPFASLEDFLGRVDASVTNRRVLESLARCGALDSLKDDRGRVAASVDRMVAFGNQLRKEIESGQASLFGEAVQSGPVLQLSPAGPLSSEERLSWEQELLGIGVSPHPVNDALQTFREAQAVPVSELPDERSNGPARVGGVIQNVRTFPTRDGKPMCSFTLSDLAGSVEAVVFNRNFERVQTLLTAGVVVVVDGKLDGANGSRRLLVDGIYTPDDATRRSPPGRRTQAGDNGGASRAPSRQSGARNDSIAGQTRRITIELVRTADRDSDLARVEAVYAALQRFNGKDEAELLVRDGERARSVPLPSRITGYCDVLASELHGLLAGGSLRVSDA